MDYREVVSAAKRLPINEQFRLVEELLRGMRQTTARSARSRRKPPVPFTRLRGMLKSEGPTLQDEDLADAYTQHLMEKYL